MDSQNKGVQERNRKFLERHGREMNYEDVIISFGGRFTGQSQIGRKQNAMVGSEDDGVLSQT